MRHILIIILLIDALSFGPITCPKNHLKSLHSLLSCLSHSGSILITLSASRPSSATLDKTRRERKKEKKCETRDLRRQGVMPFCRAAQPPDNHLNFPPLLISFGNPGVSPLECPVPAGSRMRRQSSRSSRPPPPPRLVETERRINDFC